MKKTFHSLLGSVVFFSALASAASPAKIDTHFILLAKHSKYDENPFILLERREHLWELPHVQAKADELKTEAGILKYAALASFNMVPIDPQRTAKFDNQGKEMVFAAKSERDVNPLLLELELNRLKALNPEVRELRWVEFSTTAFANNNSIIDGMCLSIDDQIGSCGLALNSFTTKVLSDCSVLTNIGAIVNNVRIPQGIESLDVVRDAEPNVIPQHFMIASKNVNFQNYWYFLEENGSYHLPLVPDAKSSQDYSEKVQQHFQLDYKTDANMYTEISNLHQDVKTGQYYSLIGHVHSAEFEATITSKGSLWCSPITVPIACIMPAFSVNCIDENGIPHNRTVAFDKDRVCPLLTNVSSNHRIHFPNGYRSVGTLLVRTVNNKWYSLFMASGNAANAGWAVPGDLLVYPEGYGSDHDLLLVGALRILEEKTFGAIKLDIDKVEEECTTISKSNKHGFIDRYQICHVDNNPAYASGEIRKRMHTAKDSFEFPGNVRWICLDDILTAAQLWEAPSPFIVNAETLSDNESYMYHSNYLLNHQDLSVLMHHDFFMSLESAIAKKNSFNSAFMKYSIKADTRAYAGALMLDSVTGRIGFAKDGQTSMPLIPFHSYTSSSTKKGTDIGADVFSAVPLHIMKLIHPILNYDTAVNNIGVSKNIVLHEVTAYSFRNEKIEWIEISKIATHPTLSDEDKAIFADASCKESLKYWISFYASKVDLTINTSQKTVNNTSSSTSTTTTTPITTTTATNINITTTSTCTSTSTITGSTANATTATTINTMAPKSTNTPQGNNTGPNVSDSKLDSVHMNSADLETAKNAIDSGQLSSNQSNSQNSSSNSNSSSTPMVSNDTSVDGLVLFFLSVICAAGILGSRSILK